MRKERLVWQAIVTDISSLPPRKRMSFFAKKGEAQMLSDHGYSAGVELFAYICNDVS